METEQLLEKIISMAGEIALLKKERDELLGRIFSYKKEIEKLEDKVEKLKKQTQCKKF